MMTATPTFFLYKPYIPIIFYYKHFFNYSVLKKNLNFFEKMPSEGLELVILLHTQ